MADNDSSGVTYEASAWNVKFDGEWRGMIFANSDRQFQACGDVTTFHDAFEEALAALTSRDRDQFRAWCRFADTPQAVAA